MGFIGDLFTPEPQIVQPQEIELPEAPPPPEETLRNLGQAPGLAGRQFTQRASIARQLGLPVSGVNIPRL